MLNKDLNLEFIPLIVTSVIARLNTPLIMLATRRVSFTTYLKGIKQSRSIKVANILCIMNVLSK